MGLIGLVVAVVIAVAAVVYSRRQMSNGAAQRAAVYQQAHEDARLAEQESKAIILAAKEEALRLRAEVEAEVRDRRNELTRGEQRLAQREESMERRRKEIETGEQKLERREEELVQLKAKLDADEASIDGELQRIANLSQEAARAELLARVESEITADVAERIRLADERVREEADDRARHILVQTMQRVASDETGEASVTVMHLPSDELKGRIIGREGRNIRALEAATGVDVIVDDTPEAIVLSAFDPVRREVARLTLDRLFADGRIHPARIEEIVAKTRSEMSQRLRDDGANACRDVGVPTVHPEIETLLGTLRFRNSYGQNVLEHSLEVAALSGMIAAEIGADQQEAKEVGLFHDIGKAAEHDIDGSHAVIGAEILARLGRPQSVVHAVRAHHYDEEPRSVGAFILMTADAISASRKGARREGLASAVKRIDKLEDIAADFTGVERAFCIQAGKEIRVMVRPEDVDDDSAQVLARQIARRLHAEGSYAGRIKVVVLRETRSVEYAK